MNIKPATVDFVLSAGIACRPAYHTQKLGMRMFASPCDWMIVFSLEDWIHILEYEAEDMFQKSHIDEDKQYVVDERNGMVSMHHFNCAQSLDSQIPSFSRKMKKRAINTANAISQSKSVGIVMNRIIRAEELVAFAERLCSLFTRTTFHILNVKDTPQQGVSVSYETEGERYVIQEVSFNDEHPLGREKSENELFWLGNVQMWSKVLRQKFCISERSVENNKLMQRLTAVESKVDSLISATELMKIAVYSIHLPRLQKEMRYYRFMSHITWGKRRKKYKDKRKRIREEIRKYASFLTCM